MYLSVIIPAFNAQESLARCVNSIQAAIEQLGQASFDAEIIIVNDGSQDRTQEVADDLAHKSPHITVIKQDNLGVSTARNQGLSIASGEWVCFVDDDDTIKDDALLLFSQVKPDSDIAVLRSFCKEKERYSWSRYFEIGRAYNKDEVMQKGYLRGSICGCIFNRAFLLDNHLHFPQGLRLSEDTVFFGACLSTIHSICFLDIPFYLITPRQNSASRKRNKEDLNALSQAIRVATTQISDPAVRYYTAFKLIINYSSRSVDCHVPAHEAQKSISDILPLPLRGIHTEKWKIALLNISYPLFYCLIRLRNRLSGK